MKKTIVLCLALLLAFVFTACGQTPSPDAPPTATDAVPTETAATPAPTDTPQPTDLPAPDYAGHYAPVLAEYRAVVRYGVERAETYDWMGVEDALQGMYGEADEDIFGYALEDLSGDGIPELILLDDGGMIFALYTLAEDAPYQTATYWSRYFCDIDAGGLFHVHGSSGAADSSDSILRLSPDGREFTLVEELGVESGYMENGNYVQLDEPQWYHITQEGEKIIVDEGQWAQLWQGFATSNIELASFSFQPLFARPLARDTAPAYAQAYLDILWENGVEIRGDTQAPSGGSGQVVLRDLNGDGTPELLYMRQNIDPWPGFYQYGLYVWTYADAATPALEVESLIAYVGGSSNFVVLHGADGALYTYTAWLNQDYAEYYARYVLEAGVLRETDAFTYHKAPVEGSDAFTEEYLRNGEAIGEADYQAAVDGITAQGGAIFMADFDTAGQGWSLPSEMMTYDEAVEYLVGIE